MEWSAGQYVKFEDERTRPARDLLNAIPTWPVRNAIDLGCGPGNSTELLVARYPEGEVSGIDTSPDMIAQARKRLPDLRFDIADIAAWQEPKSKDVIFANAVLQWLPDHAALLPRLVDSLSPGGSLAIQMPDNLGEPCHIAMREVAQSGPWAERLRPADATRTEILTPDGYYRILRPIGARVDIWRTVYHHVMQGADGIVEWFKGSGLRPYLNLLTADETPEYLARYRAQIEKSYRPHANGETLLPFPRLFIVVTR
jgi:trans-aconitate 2-methyltransferase